MTLFGWDASDYDWGRGPMDLVAAKSAGITFFTHKATEGTHVRHSHYGEALNRARAAGIEFLGAYIVPRSGPSVAVQVDYFLNYVTEQTPWWKDFPGFFFQVDTEKWSYDNVSPQRGADVCVEIRRRTGRQVVHYAPRWAYGDTIPGSDPLWSSNYGSNPAIPFMDAYPGDSSSRWVAYSGRTPVFLQYGSNTKIGFQPTCDANAFRGSLADLRTFIGGTQMATERILQHSTVRQINGYYCGPAAVQIALSTRGISVSQNELASKLGTTTAGTNSVTDIDRVMDSYINPGREDLEPVFVSGNDVTPDEAAAFKSNMLKSINAAYGVVVNVVGTGRDVDGNSYTYSGGHYVAVTGYRASGDQFLVSDPAIGRDYWMTADALDTWMAARGYVWAAHAPDESAPVPPTQVGPGAPFPLPAGHYYGDIAGPAESHGGYYANERPVIAAIQLRVIELGHVPGITAGTSQATAWADGIFEAPTVEAVKRFQAANGLVQDGKVGPNTWSSLFPVVVEPEPEPEPIPEPEPEPQPEPEPGPSADEIADAVLARFINSTAYAELLEEKAFEGSQRAENS